MNSQAQNLHHDAADIMNHWIACNIYTKTIKSIREKLEKMSQTYTTLKNIQPKKSETFSNNLKHCAKECESYQNQWQKQTENTSETLKRKIN